MLWPRVYADLRMAGVRGEDGGTSTRGDDQMNDEEPLRSAAARRAAELPRAAVHHYGTPQ